MEILELCERRLYRPQASVDETLNGLFVDHVLGDQFVPRDSNGIWIQVFVVLMLDTPGESVRKRFVGTSLGPFLAGAVVPADILNPSIFPLIDPGFSHILALSLC